MLYRFACFTLDSERSVLTANGEPVLLARKCVEMLRVLAENAGTVMTKSDLLDAVWPEGFVEESNLTQNVYLLRQMFKQHGFADAIQTLPKLGYRLTIPLETAHYSPVGVRAGLAAACAAALLLAMLAAAFSPLQRPPALSAADRRSYELGRYYWSLRTVAGLHRSIVYFARVARAEPRSALGYAGLADAYLGLFDYECDGAPCARYARLSRANAERAVSVDPASAPARTSLAMALRVFDRNYTASDAEFQRAIALDPHYALAHEWYGNSLLLRARVQDARRELETAAVLEPVAPATYGWLARAEYYAHQYRLAIGYAREALAINPSRYETRLVLGLSYEALGDNRRSISAFRGLAEAPALIAGVEARRGAAVKARALLAAAAADNADTALAFIALHDYARALAVLRRAHFADEVNRRFLALDPRLDPVRTDVRFRPWTS